MTVYYSVSCMNLSSYYNNVEQVTKNMVRTFHTTTPYVLYSLAMFSRLTTVNGFDLATQAATCYTTCEKNCGFECDYLFDNPLVYGLVGSGIFVVSALMGHCVYNDSCRKKDKNKAFAQQKE